ncbi:MAG: ABC transporter permease [Bacilli bacterium]|nr:ABC transporter permease [Bacilli bacterium]
MKRYLLRRILFAIFSLLVVTGTVMFMTYNLINPDTILQGDPNKTKYKDNELEIYKHNAFRDAGYETYVNFSTYLVDIYTTKYGPDYAEEESYLAAYQSLYDTENYTSNADVISFSDTYSKQGYTITYYAPKYRFKKIISSPYLIAVKKFNVFERFANYLGSFFSFETIWDVQDPNLTDRYIRWEWDARSHMPALVGSGTTHKYLLYFDDKFPFVHQNFFHIRLGKSNSTYRGVDVSNVLSMNTGNVVFTDQEYPVDVGTGNTHSTSLDFHTVTYSSTIDAYSESVYGVGEHYINAEQSTSGLTRIGNSFVIGITSVVLVYIFGLPIGIWMAKRKDKLVDKIGNAYIVFIMAIPSLAYIFIFQAFGVMAGLQSKWSSDGFLPVMMILPVISLALPSIGGLMKWMRRYMIDQSNADYVKFARSNGMTEGEIFSKHISRNAFIYLVHGIPADILFAMVGALITERVYAVPGIGGLLTNAVTAHDNGIVIAGTVFYTFLSIAALILGDLLLAKYDPRVSFTNERG